MTKTFGTIKAKNAKGEIINFTMTSRKVFNESQTLLIANGYEVDASWGYKLFNSASDVLEEMNFWSR